MESNHSAQWQPVYSRPCLPGHRATPKSVAVFRFVRHHSPFASKARRRFSSAIPASVIEKHTSNVSRRSPFANVFMLRRRDRRAVRAHPSPFPSLAALSATERTQVDAGRLERAAARVIAASCSAFTMI